MNLYFALIDSNTTCLNRQNMIELSHGAIVLQGVLAFIRQKDGGDAYEKSF